MTADRPHPEDAAHLLAEFAEDLSALSGEAATIEAILRRAHDLFPETRHASLTMRRRDTYQTLGATSATASAADHAQYELREGPCVDATDHGEWYRSGDVAKDIRWPRWGPAAAKLGLRSMLSVHLTAHGRPFGSLNISSDRVGAFGDRDEVDLAALFAIHAATALASARRIAGLETALASRADIGVAQGILIATYGLDRRSSFAALARISSHTNVKVRDIAAEVIRTGTLPEHPNRHD